MSNFYNVVCSSGGRFYQPKESKHDVTAVNIIVEIQTAQHTRWNSRPPRIYVFSTMNDVIINAECNGHSLNTVTPWSLCRLEKKFIIIIRFKWKLSVSSCWLPKWSQQRRRRFMYKQHILYQTLSQTRMSQFQPFAYYSHCNCASLIKCSLSCHLDRSIGSGLSKCSSDGKVLSSWFATTHCHSHGINCSGLFFRWQKMAERQDSLSANRPSSWLNT